MSIRVFCGMERFQEDWFWESEAEKQQFIEVKENLTAFIETKKEALRLGIFGEQLLEPIIADQVLRLIGKHTGNSLIGAIEDDMLDSHFPEIIKDILNYVEGLSDIEIYQSIDRHKCLFVNDSNTISYKAASDIVFYTIQSKYYQMQFQLYPIMDEYKSLIC